jgi:hypothetical protein
LQLEAYLRSLRRYWPKAPIQTVVIYRPELFEHEYESVFEAFREIGVVKERDFHSDVLNVLAEIETEYVLLGIDDIFFFDSIDFDIVDETFCQAGDGIFGFTLRFGPQSLEIQDDEISSEQVGNQTGYKLAWTKGKSVHSGHPFEPCCNLYRASVVRQILDRLNRNAC